jgi:integrase
MAVTAKQIESIKPGDKEILLDIGEGLRLRIFPSGVRSWVLRYQLKGKRKVMALGKYEHVSLKEARAKAAEARKLINEGTCPIDHAKEEEEKLQRQAEAERLARESIRTVHQVIQDWLRLEIDTCRKDGGVEVRRMLAKDVLPFVGHKELGNVTKANVLDILDRVKMRGSRIQANHVFADMRQFFNWCLRRELIDKSPMTGLSKEKDAGGKVTERERVLSNEELKLLRDQLPAAKMERQNELALWIQLSTIVRIGELLQARWEHIDFNAGTWTIPDTKNGKTHTVYMSAFAHRHFKELRTLTGWSAWCYPTTRTTDKHVCLKTITRQVDDRQRETAMQGRSKSTGSLTLPGGKWTPHDLRRTGATLMGELGILSEVIERCMNHDEANRIKRIYQRYDLKAERMDAWGRLGEHLDRILYINSLNEQPN